jgi:hypothetical protein
MRQLSGFLDVAGLAFLQAHGWMGYHDLTWADSLLSSSSFSVIG